jgi:geranylgeranyl diphosphate synthase type II
MNSDLAAFFDRVRPAIETTLDKLIPTPQNTPSRIHEAMRYSTLHAGKRIRPCLCVAAFSAWHEDWKPVIPVAAAIEMIHSYSLIHDDLPAMDNDDFRRGKPSCHRQFGEAIAILAGDGLLTLAFEVLAQCEDFPAEYLLRAGAVLAQAAGTSGGMIAGQVLDLEAEGNPVTAQDLERIHRSKTGALIGASVWIGAYLGKAPQTDLKNVVAFCDHIGLAFQVIDDILDAAEGRDQHRQKATYPQLFGLQKSREIAQELMRNARGALEPLGSRAVLLGEFCNYLENRTH